MEEEEEETHAVMSMRKRASTRQRRVSAHNYQAAVASWM